MLIFGRVISALLCTEAAMTLVTGGMGGLGLIASYHMAAEFGVPVISTSRSGRFSTPGAMPLQLMEAIQAHTLHYSVKCDAGNAKELHDLMDVLGRGIATGKENQSAQIDEVIAAVNRKMQILPPAALQSLLELMRSVEDRLQEAITDCKSVANEKVSQSTLNQLQRQETQIEQTIATLQDRIAAVRQDPYDDVVTSDVSKAANSLTSQLSKEGERTKSKQV